jgi:hypothetical protein
MLRLRVHSPAAVVVAALDLDDVGALLAPMLRRESMASTSVSVKARHRPQLHVTRQRSVVLLALVRRQWCAMWAKVVPMV